MLLTCHSFSLRAYWSGPIVNVDTIKQEKEAEKLDNNNLDGNEINPYYKIIANNVERDNMVISQMDQWSILSNVVNYVKYERHPRNYYDLDIKTRDQKSHKKMYGNEEERHVLELGFGNAP